MRHIAQGRQHRKHRGEVGITPRKEPGLVCQGPDVVAALVHGLPGLFALDGLSLSDGPALLGELVFGPLFCRG
jgi:hypothetical protein